MIRIIKSDLLDAPADIIAQSNNCMVCHGAGVALQIVKKWPEVLDADMETEKGDKSKLGSCNFVSLDSPTGRIKTVVLMYSQFKYGTSERQVNYEFLYRCLKELNGRITNKNLTLALPYGLSSGLAGGDFRIVLAMIESIFGDHNSLEVLICKKD